MSSAERRRARFDEIFARHFRAVLAYALRRVDEPADAADAAAETLLVAWRRMGAVPAEPDTRLWLLATARRVLANQRRGDRRRGALADRLRAEVAAMPAPDPADDAVSALVREALRGLRDDDREILSLVCWEGLDPAQAAAVMGIPAATARTRLRRARGRMRDALTALGWDAPAPPPAPVPACASPEEIR